VSDQWPEDAFEQEEADLDTWEEPEPELQTSLTPEELEEARAEGMAEAKALFESDRQAAATQAERSRASVLRQRLRDIDQGVEKLTADRRSHPDDPSAQALLAHRISEALVDRADASNQLAALEERLPFMGRATEELQRSADDNDIAIEELKASMNAMLPLRKKRAEGELRTLLVKRAEETRELEHRGMFSAMEQNNAQRAEKAAREAFDTESVEIRKEITRLNQQLGTPIGDPVKVDLARRIAALTRRLVDPSRAQKHLETVTTRQSERINQARRDLLTDQLSG
jgi:hypothetical protein